MIPPTADLSLQGTTVALREELVDSRTLKQVQDRCLGCGCQIPMARLLVTRQWPQNCFFASEGCTPS